MFRIPAHKNTQNPPGQYFYPPLDETPVHEVREPDPPPYKVEEPEQPDT